MFNRLSLMMPYLELEQMEKANLFVGYLVDANVSESIIESIYLEKGWITSYIQLPAKLWEQSLLKPFTCYYHESLITNAKPARFNSKTGVFSSPKVLYCEPRIVLSADDFINYYYTKLKTLPECKNYKRDIGALDFLLEKHPYILLNDNKIETIDFLYHLIDHASLSQQSKYLSLLDIYNQYFNGFMMYLDTCYFSYNRYFILRTGESVSCSK